MDAAAECSVTFATLERRTANTKPKLIEEVYGGPENGGWEERWMCEPPVLGVRFKVIEQEWNEEFSVRTIYKVEL